MSARHTMQIKRSKSGTSTMVVAETFQERVAVMTALICLLLMFVCAHQAAAADRRPPEMTYPADRDLDANRIDDGLDARIAARVDDPEADQSIGVVVGLFAEPDRADLATFTSLGGTIRHVYRSAVYGYSGTLPAGSVSELAWALGDNLCIVEYNARIHASLEDSTRQVRARPHVWYDGVDGDPNTVIAVMDTGIDFTHPDLTGKMVYWEDFTTENEASATDRNGHGTHIAGILAGTGSAIAGTSGQFDLTTTMSDVFEAAPAGYVDMIKIPILASGYNVDSDLVWDSAGTGQVNFRTPDEAGCWPDTCGFICSPGECCEGLGCSCPGGCWQNGQTDTTSPLQGSWSIVSHADHRVWKARAGNETGLDGDPFSLLVTVPFQHINDSVGDGYRLFRGMAPQSNLVGLKILDINGEESNVDNWIAAVDWLVATNNINAAKRNNQYYKIKVANMSVNMDPGDSSGMLDTSVNSAVANGTVMVVSAGNGFDDDGGPTVITDPGLADKVLTVGAIDDFGAMTYYSSNGAGGSGKPDVVAPGGSHSWDENLGSEITSCDTNVNDAHTVDFDDQNPDDYSNLHGTSFAAPHVAGLAALIIDAQQHACGDGFDCQFTYTFSEADALLVKMLILATATETNMAGECTQGASPICNNPSLQRGGKDLAEGYGRINADAAVEAVLHQWWGQQIGGAQGGGGGSCCGSGFGSRQLGPGQFEKKAWATTVLLCSHPSPHDITLSVPDDADFDLYLYDDEPDANGEPQIVASSTNAGSGVDEMISRTASCSAGACPYEEYYLVVKWVSGSGTFELQDSVGGGCGQQIGLIIEGGEFSEGDLGPWEFESDFPGGSPEPQVSIEDISPQQDAVRILREGAADQSSAVIFQPVGENVSANEQVSVSLDVRIATHSFGDYDDVNVYPANLWLEYKDELGDTYTFRRSFYTIVTGGHTPDAEPLAEQLQEDVWYHRSFNLSNLTPAIAEIIEIRAGAQGWSYDVAFDNIALVVSGGGGVDCNDNGIEDTVEIAEGISSDCDGNFVPDGCDPDEDLDTVPDACDNCLTVQNPGQEDTESGVIFSDDFESGTFVGWDFTYSSSDGQQNGTNIAGEWASEVIFDPFGPGYVARLYAQSNAHGGASGPWSDVAAINRYLGGATGVSFGLCLSDIQGSGGTGASYFQVAVLDPADQSHLISYGFSTTGDIGGSIKSVVAPFSCQGVVLDFAEDYENLTGQQLQGRVEVRFLAYADYAESAAPGSRVRTTDLTIDNIQVTTVADGLGDACDNCAEYHNPDQEDCDNDGIGDVCEIADGSSEDADHNGVPDQCQACAADLSGDGTVDAADLAMLLGDWGPCVGCPADLNSDNVVDATDLAQLLGSWGSC